MKGDLLIKTHICLLEQEYSSSTIQKSQNISKDKLLCRHLYNPEVFFRKAFAKLNSKPKISASVKRVKRGSALPLLNYLTLAYLRHIEVTAAYFFKFSWGKK